MLSLGSDARGPILSGTPLERPLRAAPVDAYGLEQRAARLTSRSVKRESKDAGLARRGAGAGRAGGDPTLGRACAIAARVVTRAAARPDVSRRPPASRTPA